MELGRFGWLRGALDGFSPMCFSPAITLNIQLSPDVQFFIFSMIILMALNLVNLPVKIWEVGDLAPSCNNEIMVRVRGSYTFPFEDTVVKSIVIVTANWDGGLKRAGLIF